MIFLVVDSELKSTHFKKYINLETFTAYDFLDIFPNTTHCTAYNGCWFIYHSKLVISYNSFAHFVWLVGLSEVSAGDRDCRFALMGKIHRPSTSISKHVKLDFWVPELNGTSPNF